MLRKRNDERHRVFGVFCKEDLTCHKPERQF